MVASRENPYQGSSDISQNSIEKMDPKNPPKASGDSGQNALLDNTENSRPDLEQKILLPWALQAAAREVLPDFEIAKCLRVPRASMVSILYDTQHRKANYNGLCMCHSVWNCPICSSKISERRRIELSGGIGYFNELETGCIALVTYTIKHTYHNTLGELLTPFLDAHDHMKGGRTARDFKEQYGLVGRIRCLETTWGFGSGWHPHIHELLFLGNDGIDIQKCQDVLWKSWRHNTARFGLAVDRKAFDFQITRGAIADYVAKYGRLPIRTPWGSEHELTKTHVKQARLKGRFSAFGLLAAIAEGHDELRPVFREYAEWFKGRSQLHWSKGLKLMLGVKDKSDKELAEEVREHEILLGNLTLDEWRKVLKCDARGELIVAASGGDWSAVVDCLCRLGIRVDKTI